MSKNPTKAQREIWGKMVELVCVICGAHAQVHHCGTGMGGRKNHDFCIPLCYFHHQGEQGIHTLSRRVWCEIYGTEQELYEKTKQRMGVE